MASSLSKTSNPPLSSSTRLIPHQPQFMQTQTETTHHHRRQERERQLSYEKKLVKIQNTQTQLIEENLMPINFSSSSSSTNSLPEMEMKEQERSRRKSSRILRGLTSALMSYPVLDSLPPSTSASLEGAPANIPNSNYHLKWNDHVSSTVNAIQCLLANETFVDVTLVCDEDDEKKSGGAAPNKMMNGNSFRNLNTRRSSRREQQQKQHRFKDEEDMDDFADDEENEPMNDSKGTYQVKLKAHKIILSTCSEYFSKIFQENPCKHPVIVLKDFAGWEVRALLDFMYKGQVIVRPERLETLVKAADALQIRGLRECIEKSEEWVRMKRLRTRERMVEDFDNEVESLEAKTRVLNRTSDNTKQEPPPTSTNTSHHPRSHQMEHESGPSSPKLLNLSMSGEGLSPHLNSTQDESKGPQTSIMHQTSAAPVHHNHQTNSSAPSPPFPRRKQARPRRRSGDFVAQDLRITVTPPLVQPSTPTNQELASVNDYHLHNNNNKIHDFTMGSNKGGFERPPHLNHLISNHFLKNWHLGGMGSPIGTPPHPHSSPMKHELDSDDETSSPPDRFRSPPGTPDSASPIFESKQFTPDGIPLFNDPISGMQFKASPPSPSFFLNLNNGHPLMSGQHSDSESNNPETASTPPSVFSPAGFHHNNNNGGGGAGGQQPWPGLPLGPAPIFGRHRAQHSAPRGGPPRAWSNADLTEALHNVWNKKMTTSQASRIFGIPYNSLLMYVRGKYGKSLKLDLLKKGLDLALENSNNAAAAAAAAANSLNTNGNSIPGTLISNNNNNNNTPSGFLSKSKSHQSQYSNHSEDSPPSGLTLTHSHIGNSGGGDRSEPQDGIPSGFNPFSAVSSIFGDYPPPFPFPPSLSHILPPVNHLSAVDKVSASRRNDGDK